MAFIRAHQLNLMIFMSGICFILSFMTLLMESLTSRRKSILALMELSAMLLLQFDRFAYIYRGDTSELGYFMVRICNGMVFFLSIFIPHLVTQYLKDMIQDEGKQVTVPLALMICEALFLVHTVLIIVSQFTGLFYTFDEQNRYQRSSGFLISYLFPILIVLLQEVTIVQYRARLSKGLVRFLALTIAMPTLISALQLILYGISLTTLTMVLMVIVFYIYALNDMSRTVETARKRELALSEEAAKREAAMFEQTTEALASAIDAKDKYTHGHSARVAALSGQIAKEAGYSDADCNQIYFAALLHDVGKIGIRDDIINKVGKLTDEEYEQVKRHPIIGDQILSSIRQSPSLRLGAHYHHERYDGKGYPDGLRGESIPEMARIIAVADAYDAMSSTRSYRDKLSEQETVQELTEGMGKQFDPKFARILLQILERENKQG